MYIKILLYYILGYVNISVEGYFLERFINICISKRILLWNVKRKKSSVLYANIGIKEFKKIKEIAKITKCKVEIKKKKGFPFILNRYKKRKLFFASLIIIILFIMTISNFVWNIEVTGNNTIPTEEIINDINEIGLKTGMPKQKIDTKEIVSSLRLKRDDIAWVRYSH